MDSDAILLFSKCYLCVAEYIGVRLLAIFFFYSYCFSIDCFLSITVALSSKNIFSDADISRWSPSYRFVYQMVEGEYWICRTGKQIYILKSIFFYLLNSSTSGSSYLISRNHDFSAWMSAPT